MPSYVYYGTYYSNILICQVPYSPTSDLIWPFRSCDNRNFTGPITGYHTSMINWQFTLIKRDTTCASACVKDHRAKTMSYKQFCRAEGFIKKLEAPSPQICKCCRDRSITKRHNCSCPSNSNSKTPIWQKGVTYVVKVQTAERGFARKNRASFLNLACGESPAFSSPSVLSNCTWFQH